MAKSKKSGLNMEKLLKRKEQLEKGGGNYDFWTPSSGRNVIRILPPKGDSDTFWSEGFVHFNVGKAMVFCLANFNKKCPVCEAIELLKKSKHKEDRNLADKMGRRTRVYMNILDRADKDTEIKVMSCGSSILKDVISMVVDPEWGDITDFDEGRDVIITKTGKGMNTEYTVMGKPKASVATDEMTEEEAQELMADLEDFITEKTYEDIVELLEGEERDDDEVEEEEVCEDCGETLEDCICNEPEDEEPEDEEPEEKPTRKPGGKGGRNSKNSSLKDEIRDKINRNKKK